MTHPDRFPPAGSAAGPEAPDGTAGRPGSRRVPMVLATVATAGGLALGGYGIASAASPTPTPSASGSAAPAPSASPSEGSSTGRTGRGTGSDGRITALSGSSITVTSDSGTATTYRTTASTTVHQDRDTTVARSVLQVGDRVRVTAPAASGSTPATATDIDLQLPRLDGTVTAVAADSITIRDRDGFTRTIVTTSSTTYAKDDAAATRAAVTTGVRVRAEGRVDANGTSLDASRVQVVTTDPAGDGSGHGGHGGRMGGGHGRGPGGGASDGEGGTSSPSPSASPSATTES